MKYIDADRLREKIAEQMESLPREVGRSTATITSNGYGRMQAFQIMRSIIDSLQQEHQEVNLDSKVTFDCISKKVTMTIRELINYYIDRECCDVAEECGF